VLTHTIPSVRYRRYTIGDADYLVATAGSGPAVLLLHGFPQTHYCWRGVIPGLAERHFVVAPDLRGYGATSAPAGGPKGEGYTKREMATDLFEVMERLGIEEEVRVVGHDRGGRVAYRMALDEPGRVVRLAVLNIVPTLEQFERMGAGPSLGYWPWFLLAQPAPFPERLLSASRREVLEYVFDSWTADRAAIDAAAFAHYLDALDEVTIAAMCADYRASFWGDREQDATDRDAGRRIECPVLVVRGESETQLAEAPQVWSEWARDVKAATLPVGHFIPEEAGAPLAEVLGEFLA
jgi:haloacetate dehalogenase